MTTTIPKLYSLSKLRFYTFTQIHTLRSPFFSDELKYVYTYIYVCINLYCPGISWSDVSVSVMPPCFLTLSRSYLRCWPGLRKVRKPSPPSLSLSSSFLSSSLTLLLECGRSVAGPCALSNNISIAAMTESTEVPVTARFSARPRLLNEITLRLKIVCVLSKSYLILSRE